MHTQVLFLNELEEILELCTPDALREVAGPLTMLLARCVGSTHFQVSVHAVSVASAVHSVLQRRTYLPVTYETYQKLQRADVILHASCCTPEAI